MRPNPAEMEGLSDKDKEMMGIKSLEGVKNPDDFPEDIKQAWATDAGAGEQRKQELQTESEARKQALSAMDAKNTSRMDEGQIRTALERNQMRRIELTKQVETVKRTMESGTSTMSKDELLGESARLNGEILRLNEEDRKLQGQL